MTAAIEIPNQVPRDVGDGLRCAPGAWTFGGDVASVYDEHVRRSVPSYEAVHELVISHATRVVRSADRIYDLGCATGRLTERLAEKFEHSPVWGVDVEPTMIAAASQPFSRARYLCNDLRRIQLEQCGLVVMLYALQFVPAPERAAVVQRVFDSLRPGGALFLAEKVKRRDAAFELSCQRALYDFKRSRGFTEVQIAAKAQSLKTVLVPAFDDENVALMHNAGFGVVHHLFRHSCFDAWLAIK